MRRRCVVSSLIEQKQEVQPGMEYLMNIRPHFDNQSYIGSNKLKDKIVLISGGDSGIGRAVALNCAKENADIAIAYLNETIDAKETKEYIENLGKKCLLIETDLRESKNAKYAVEKTISEFGKINVLVNNCAVQYPQNSLLDISDEQLENTFKSNIFSYFYFTREALPYLHENDCIINTSSITSYGSDRLIDYSATKGAINTFTKSLSLSLREKRIRVNAICPGPVNTALIVASFDEDVISTFGKNSPYGRAAEPCEIAPVYVFLASDDSILINGQILDPNGWEIV